MTEARERRHGRIILSLKAPWAALTAVFITALLLRSAYLSQLASTPLSDFFSADSEHYNRVALRILAGDIAFRESVYMNPVYPLFLAAVYSVFGADPAYVGIVQAVLDSLSCVLIYLICLKAFKNKNLALLSSFIYAFYGMAIFYTGFLMRATLSVFINLALVWTLLIAKDKDRPLFWLAAGIMMGLSALITSNTILFLPLLAVWLFTFRKAGLRSGRPAVSAVMIFTGIILILLPFSFRNYVAEKRFSPFSVQGGFNFYIGNHPGSTGTYTPVRGVSDLPVVSITDSVRVAREEAGRAFTPSEASAYWFSKSFRFIRESPRLFLFLLGRKFLLFWNNTELASNLNFYFCKERIPILRMPLFSFGMIAPFAMLGLVLAAKKRLPGPGLIAFFAAAYMISLVLFFVSARYRFPCAPFMVILGAYSVFDLADIWKERRLRDLFLYVIALAAFAVFVNMDYFPVSSKNYFPTAHYNLGLAYARKDMLDQAIAEYKRAIEIKPDYAYAHYNLGFVYNRKGLVDQAIEEYKKAIGLDPGFDQAYNDLGIAYRRKNLLDEAVAAYRKAIEIDPDFAQARYNLGNAYSSEEMRAEAIAEYEKALEIDPEFGEAHNNLSFAYFREGDYEKAIYHCDRAIELGVEVHAGFLKTLEAYRK